ncbi:MAG: trypsin-like peptidase domain-containing protein, partial [Gemmatimonadales bacterium]
DRLTVRLLDGREYTSDLVGRDPNTDVAIIRIDEDDLPSVSFGDSDALRIGEWVLAIGNPLGQEFSFTVTAGIVSGRGRRLNGLQRSEWDISDFIQTDAAINPGNSGGPLININGQVVGVNAAIASQTGYYAGYSFAIPINLARTVADQLITEGRVTRAALGVSVSAATAVDAEYVDLDDVRGVTVHDFSSEDSPAKQAGIQVGDVIIEVDGERIDYVAQLQQLVGFKQPGERVEVTVARQDGERRTYTVELAEAQAAARPRVAAAEPDAEPEKASYEEKLGIRVEELSRRMVAQFPAIGDAERGVLITAVDASGPARQVLQPSRLRQGLLSIITHVNGERVETVDAFDRVTREIESGSIVSLRTILLQGDQALPRVVRFRAGG